MSYLFRPFVIAGILLCVSGWSAPKHSTAPRTATAETNLGPVPSAKSLETTPSEIVTALVAAYSNYTTLTCSFRQLSGERFSKGEIRFRKPDRLHVRWLDGTADAPLEVVANGTTLWVFMKSIATVFEQPLFQDSDELREIGDSSAASSALGKANIVALDRLVGRYHINFADVKTPVPVLASDDELRRFKLTRGRESQAYHFVAMPRDVTAGLDKLELWVSREGFVLRCRSFPATSGEIIDFLFVDYKPDVELSPEEFDFIVPANTQVVKNTLFGLEVKKRHEAVKP